MIKVNDFHLGSARSAVSMSARNSSAGVYPEKETVKENTCPSIKLVLLQFLLRPDRGRCMRIGESTSQFLYSRPHYLYGFGNA